MGEGVCPLELTQEFHSPAGLLSPPGVSVPCAWHWAAPFTQDCHQDKGTEFEFTGIQQTACIPRSRAAPTFQPLPIVWRRALWFSLTSGLCHRLSTISHTPPVGACTPAKLDRALLPGTFPPLCACNLESMSPPSRRIPALLSPGPTFSARLSGGCAVRSGVCPSPLLSGISYSLDGLVATCVLV